MRKPSRRGVRHRARRHRRPGLAYQSDARLDALLERAMPGVDEALREPVGEAPTEQTDEPGQQ